MCRLAAFPPGFKQQDAIDILELFAKGNKDGTGSVYLQDGQFIVNKWPLSLQDVISKKRPLIDHMPHDSWTIVHLRAASHGENTIENTHPFIKGHWAIAHNGIWSEYKLIKEVLKKQVEFDGETDSEVAAHLIATLGPRKFSKLVDFGGVFLGLNINGELWAIRTSGDLQIANTEYGMLIASELYYEPMTNISKDGWFRFNKAGELVQKQEYATSILTIVSSEEKEEETLEREYIKRHHFGGYPW